MTDRWSGKDYWFIIVLGTIYMFNFIDRTIISVLGEPIKRDLGLNDLQLGLMGGLAFSIFYAGLGIPLARLAERRSRVGIIASVTAIWSTMTMLCGAVANFPQMLLARMGVGVGEAGFTPALVSMISDRFEPHRRATAFSAIALGVALGGAMAALVGGMLAESIGWRWTFVAVGAPGLLLALILKLTVPEPVRKAENASLTPPFMAVLRHVGRSRGFVWLTVGSGLAALVGFGIQLFFIPLLIRKFGFDLSDAVLLFVISISLSTGLGGITGGMIVDRLSRSDLRWYGWAPAIAMLLSSVFYLAAVFQDDWRWMTGLLFLSMLNLYAFLPSIMTVTQRLVTPRMRASAAALHSFGQIVFGLGLGSVLLGWMSDRLAEARYGGAYAAQCVGGDGPVSTACMTASADGLQQALQISALFPALAVLAYLVASRGLAGEISAMDARTGTEADPAVASGATT